MLLPAIAACLRTEPPAPAQPAPDPRAGPATTCAGAPSAWVDRAVGPDTLRYAAGLEADADRAAAALLAVRPALGALLGGAATPPTVVWLTTASAEITAGSALTVSSSTAATVYLPSPSCHPDPRPRQLERTLTHELAGEYLSAVTRARDGWWFYSGPSWFVQGSEQWVTTRVHDAPPDLAAAATLKARRPPDGAVGVEGASVNVQDPYRDGEALVAWLTLAAGPEVLDRLLASRAPTFDAALAEVTGLDGPTLVDAYTRWRVP